MGSNSTQGWGKDFLSKDEYVRIVRRAASSSTLSTVGRLVTYYILPHAQWRMGFICNYFISWDILLSNNEILE